MAGPPLQSLLCSSLQYKYTDPVLNCCSHYCPGKPSNYCCCEIDMFQQDKLHNSNNYCKCIKINNFNSPVIIHPPSALTAPGRQRHWPLTTFQVPLGEQPNIGKLPFSGSAFSMHAAMINRIVPLDAMVSGYMVILCT